jgi:hypothetical protein
MPCHSRGESSGMTHRAIVPLIRVESRGGDQAEGAACPRTKLQSSAFREGIAQQVDTRVPCYGVPLDNEWNTIDNSTGYSRSLAEP